MLPEVTQVFFSNCHVLVILGPGKGGSGSLYIDTCNSGLCDMWKYAGPLAFVHACLDGMSTLQLDSRQGLPPPLLLAFVGQ